MIAAKRDRRARIRLFAAFSIFLLAWLGWAADSKAASASAITTETAGDTLQSAPQPKDQMKTLAAGYGEGTYYSQGTYYSEGTYYSQGYYQGYYEGSYKVTLTNDVLEGSNLTVTGSISKGSGTFVIDDPIDPANKLLFHSFVESPDVKNVYDGIVTLDSKGEATVMLPAYFDALNEDARYQLKPIGESMPNLYVNVQEHDNQFGIAGGVPGGRVSWQITGIRHDPFILANPIVPVVDKGPDQLVDKGQYLYPPGYPSLWTRISTAIVGFFSGLFARL